MIFILDNYDSFTYNLYQYVGLLQEDVMVARNDKITVEEIAALSPTHIILSPGPGYPCSAGILTDLIQKYSGKIPILGVCLGHQAIGEAFGGKVIKAPVLMHGKADTVLLDNTKPIFHGLNRQTEVGRYHSLAVSREGLPDVLKEIASSHDGCVMGLMHKTHPTFGIQFHPESVLTPDGMKIIRNFLKL